jgi:hypothetical protein
LAPASSDGAVVAAESESRTVRVVSDAEDNFDRFEYDVERNDVVAVLGSELESELAALED